MKKILLILLISLAAFAVVWQMQTYLAGKKPQQEFSEYQHEQYEQKLVELRAKAALDLKDPKPHRALVTSLLDGLSAPGKPNLERYQELLKELELIATLDPKDAATAIMLADIYFNEKSFQKSIDHFERYLKLKPEDHQVRGRYASALTFMSRFKDAESELKQVIKADPKSFHGYAYLSITYSQMNRIDDAYKAGDKALELAPTPEARQRFGAYLKSIGAKVPELENKPNSEELPKVAAVREVINHIKTSPIAGPKYDRFELPEDGFLLLYFKNFPMDKMPQFAKDKFLKGIKDRLSPPLTEVSILDSTSGKEMAKVK
ncbi:MAG: hypothetical protein R3A13_01645 [Bdellovibrionota bacterium]